MGSFGGLLSVQIVLGGRGSVYTGGEGDSAVSALVVKSPQQQSNEKVTPNSHKWAFRHAKKINKSYAE